jgi:hypothetical protein
VGSDNVTAAVTRTSYDEFDQIQGGELVVDTKWLRCKVLPGMFSQEWLVVIEEPMRGELASIFVDATLVRMEGAPTAGHAVDGELMVQANERGERTNVMLPVQSAELGRVLSVPSELVAD